jgi:hypothetical protein
MSLSAQRITPDRRQRVVQCAVLLHLEIQRHISGKRMIRHLGRRPNAAG